MFFNDAAMNDADARRRSGGGQDGYRDDGYQDADYQDGYGHPGYRDPNYQDPNYRDPNYQDPRYPADGYDDGYYDDGYDAAQTGRRPRVLASTASEWDYSAQDEMYVERGGPNKVLVFALAALCAALVGVGFAIYSVLSGGDDADATDTAAQSSIDGADAATDTTLDERPLPPDPTTTTIDPATTLAIALASDTFVCDDTVREFGQISGAEPNEEIAFTSPQSSGLSSGTADASGNLPIRWRCAPEQIGTTWELTATGITSGKVGTISFTGVDSTGAAELSPLAVDVFENPFACNNEVRAFATISGATANAEITFTSPEASGLRPGTAGADGKLNVRWSCSSDQAGTTWNLTATETATGRTATLSLTGN